MKNTAILFASSDVFAYALFVSIKSLFENSPKLAQESDIFIYAYRWPKHTKEIFLKTFPVQICDYDVPDYIPRTEHILRFTPALFARFEAFDLLSKYKRVICMDSDILVQKELFDNLAKLSTQISITLDGNKNCSVQRNFTKPIPSYNMSARSYNAGFIVLINPIPYKEIYNRLYQMLAKYADICCLGDQGLINLMLQEFKLSVTELPQLYNKPASSPNKNLDKSFFIHSTGHRKFWCYYYLDQWYRYFAKWLELGGNKNVVRKNSALWDKLLAKIVPSTFNVPVPDYIVFFTLAPDACRYPLKFLLFTFKRLFRIKY